MKAYRTIYILALFVILGSCEDLIEEPRSILSPESFFSNEDDLKASVVACYHPFIGRIDEDVINGVGGWNTLSVRSWALHMGADDLTSRLGPNKQRLVDFDTFIIPTSNIDNGQCWNTYYKIISACNLVIANYEKVPMDVDKRNALAAQSYFLRAYSYYNIVRFWGDAPLISEPVEGDGMDILRSPQEEIYALILKDLDFAELHLPAVWPGEPGAVTLGAAKTMLSDVYLTMAGWPLKQVDKYALAAQKAKEVMGLGYELVANYKDLFTVAKKNNIEHIWNIQADKEEHPSKLGISFQPADENGWRDYMGEVKFFEDFPDNKRKELTYYTVFNGSLSWENSQFQLPCFEKYWEPDHIDKAEINWDHLFPIYRYAEVLLIYAEAQNRVNGGPDQSCYDALNAIRQRANEGVADDAPTGLSEADFDQLVFDEKGWEFAAEQKRWHDLVRKELVEEYNKNNDQITVTITKDNYIFPIPASEREINPALTQNKGY